MAVPVGAGVVVTVAMPEPKAYPVPGKTTRPEAVVVPDPSAVEEPETLTFEEDGVSVAAEG